MILGDIGREDFEGRGKGGKAVCNMSMSKVFTDCIGAVWLYLNTEPPFGLFFVHFGLRSTTPIF